MYCTNCGTLRPPGTTSCPSCGQPYVVPAAIPNYLVGSILLTLCCCMPFGVVALIYATQVNAKLAVGDLAGAQLASNRARLWCWITILMGLITGAGMSLLSFLDR